MRAVLAAMFLVGCASAGSPRVSGDDTGDPVDAMVSPDACPDTDTDGTCNNVDKCPGFNDALDADMDMVADGCDKCPGVDDRPDVNLNSTPDCLEYMTRTINLKAVNGNLWRGWQSSGGGHTSTNDNTLTGENAGAFYNSYFVFALTGFTASSIQAVTLEIQLEQYQTADATETFSVWDVTAASTNVENTNDINIYNDLMTGTQYGTLNTTAAQLNTILSVPLNAMAATHATQKLNNDFVLGIHLDTTPGWIRFGHTGAAAPATVIRLVVKYLP